MDISLENQGGWMHDLRQGRLPLHRFKKIAFLLAFGIASSGFCATQGVLPCLAEISEDREGLPGGDPASVILADLGIEKIAPGRPLPYHLKPQFSAVYSSVDPKVIEEKLGNVARDSRVLVLQDENVGLVRFLQTQGIEATGLRSTALASGDRPADFDGKVRRYESEILLSGIQHLLPFGRFDVVLSHRVLQRLDERTFHKVLRETWSALEPGGLAIHTFALDYSALHLAKKDLGGAMVALVEKALSDKAHDVAVYLGTTQVGQPVRNEFREALAQEAVKANYDDLDLKERYVQLTSPRVSLLRIVISKPEESAVRSSKEATESPEPSLLQWIGSLFW